MMPLAMITGNQNIAKSMPILTLVVSMNEGYEKGVHTKILAISDLHVPFQLPIETF